MAWDEVQEGAKAQLRRVHFYENWRVSAALGAIVGAGFVLLLQAIF
jgi:hypothetical protein